MADVIDMANDYAEETLARAISNRTVFRGASNTNCEDCGCEIPQKRREYVQGCKLCVDCQHISEVRRG